LTVIATVQTQNATTTTSTEANSSVTEAASSIPQLTQTTTSVSCSPESVESDTSTTCTVTVSGNGPTGPVDFYTTSTDGTLDPESCSLVAGSCSVQYTDGMYGQPTITAEYGGDDYNLGSQGQTTVSITGGQEEEVCPGFYLSEGLAPAASTTGDDNIYITVHWGGEIPSGGLSVEFGAYPHSQDITADFAFNPITMYGASSSVLMNIKTQGAPDGNYVVSVAAQTTDPQTDEQCTTGINADVTVSATTAFVQTTGENQSEAIWLNGLASPFQVSGNITASQYSNFLAHLDQNGKLASLTFTLTGPTGTDGTGTITIPKSLVAPGYTPELYISGQQVQIKVTQDSTNFYITYTTHFSVHSAQLQFAPLGSTTGGTSQIIAKIEEVVPGYLIIIGIPVIFLALVALIVKRGKDGEVKGSTPLGSPTSPSSTPVPVVSSSSKAPTPTNTVVSSPAVPHSTPSPQIPSPAITSVIPGPANPYGFCGKCGQPLDRDDKFCGSCGAGSS